MSDHLSLEFNLIKFEISFSVVLHNFKVAIDWLILIDFQWVIINFFLCEHHSLIIYEILHLLEIAVFIWILMLHKNDVGLFSILLFYHFWLEFKADEKPVWLLLVSLSIWLVHRWFLKVFYVCEYIYWLHEEDVFFEKDEAHQIIVNHNQYVLEYSFLPDCNLFGI